MILCGNRADFLLSVSSSLSVRCSLLLLLLGEPSPVDKELKWSEKSFQAKIKIVILCILKMVIKLKKNIGACE